MALTKTKETELKRVAGKPNLSVCTYMNSTTLKTRALICPMCPAEQTRLAITSKEESGGPYLVRCYVDVDLAHQSGVKIYDGFGYGLAENYAYM
jgi:hypothetical protein